MGLKRRLNKHLSWAVCGVGLLALSTPLVYAEDTTAWEHGQEELRQGLPTGELRTFYPRKLNELGYEMTALNYSDEDYLEYEVVKGAYSYEVQIDIDEKTQKATEIEIDPNRWMTESTERALDRNKLLAAIDDPDFYVVFYGYRYSDRDQARVEEMVKNLEGLPTGNDAAFYKDELKRRGYTISKIHTDDKEALKLEMVKNARSVAFAVTFDPQTGQSTDVNAAPLWWESAATERVREKQEQQVEQSKAETRLGVQPQTSPKAASEQQS
jgi:hypothetical protein